MNRPRVAHQRRNLVGRAVERLRRVEVQGVVHRGEQLLGSDRAIGGSGGVVVAGSNDLTASDSAAGHCDAPDSRPMVAPPGRVDPRCAAELANGRHQGRVQQAFRLQVVKQGRERLVERGRELPLVIL